MFLLGPLLVWWTSPGSAASVTCASEDELEIRPSRAKLWHSLFHAARVCKALL